MIQIPTLTDLYNNIVADLEVGMGDTFPAFGKVFLKILAGVQAAKLKLYYLAIANLQKNIFVDTAEPEAIGGTLERFGRVKLGRSPFAATAGQYTATVTGTTASVIPAQTTFKSDDSSANPAKLFILDTAYTMPGTTGTITLRALEVGLDAKLSVGNTLTATAPIAGVSSTATVTAETIAPIAAESVEEYRTKTLDAYRLEPQGGSASDYRLWAADAQGCKTAYAYAKSGAPNEVNVYVEANPADSTDGKGTPTGTILTDVAAVIEFDPDTTRPLEERGRRPIGVFAVNVLAVTPKDIAITITGTSYTTAQQTAIQNALQGGVNAMRPFVAACDVLEEKNDVLDNNQIINMILNAVPGVAFGTVSFTVAGAPFSSYTFTGGNIPYFNSVTFS